MSIIEGILAVEIAKAWKADEVDKKAMAKNSRAFGKEAEAKLKVRRHEKMLFDKMKINAIRKSAILQCHINRFLEIYRVIDEYQLNIGLGIKEIGKIDIIQKQMVHTINLPSVASGLAKTDTQMIVQYAFYGIGGMIMKDSKENEKLASRNMANADVVMAQADSICVLYDGLGERVQACTDILQKLAAKDNIAINHIESMLKTKGQNEELYSQMDVDAINLCSELNILIYEIINTPLIDENNEFTKASETLINKGQKYLKQLC